MRMSLRVLGCATVLSVGGAVAATRASGGEETLRAAVRDLIVRAYRNTEGVAPGTPRTQARLFAARCAWTVSTHWRSLTGTPYEPKASVPGMVTFFLPDDAAEVDEVSIVLVTGPYDEDEMAKAVVEAGKEVGLSLEPDDEDPGLYWDYRTKGRDLWVGLGGGVVVIEIDKPDDEPETATGGTVPK